MTDNITLPRSVVEQVLEALEYERDANNPLDWHHDKTMHALRAALEQPQVEQEPVAWQRRMRTKWMRDGEWWPWQECSKEVAYDCKQAPVIDDWEYESRPLYTHPQPKREPLTVGQINRLIADGKLPLSGNPYEVARAIEAAHGIKEQ